MRTTQNKAIPWRQFSDSIPLLWLSSLDRSHPNKQNHNWLTTAADLSSVIKKNKQKNPQRVVLITTHRPLPPDQNPTALLIRIPQWLPAHGIQSSFTRAYLDWLLQPSEYMAGQEPVLHGLLFRIGPGMQQTCDILRVPVAAAAGFSFTDWPIIVCNGKVDWSFY